MDKDANAPTDSAKPQPASTGGAVAGSANTVDVASSASGPPDNAAEATTSAVHSEGFRPDAASVTAPQQASSANVEAAASQTAAPVDFSSFSSANKQQSPFAVTAGGGKAAFGDSSNGLTFGSAAGGFGAIGELRQMCTVLAASHVHQDASVISRLRQLL